MHNLTSLRFMEAALMAGDTTLAHKVSNAVKKDLEQQIIFYSTLSGDKAEQMAEDKRSAENYLRGIDEILQSYNPRIQIPGKVMTPQDTGKASTEVKPKAKG
jgi:hypothetical protein